MGLKQQVRSRKMDSTFDPTEAEWKFSEIPLAKVRGDLATANCLAIGITQTNDIRCKFDTLRVCTTTEF